MSNNLPLRGQLTNQPMYKLTNQLINQLTNFIMQNKPNLQNAKMNVSTFETKGYENFRPFSRRKNKPKQSQFKPNFSPKLGSFFQYWLCNSSIFQI